jgi:hypothetical protein
VIVENVPGAALNLGAAGSPAQVRADQQLDQNAKTDLRLAA